MSRAHATAGRRAMGGFGTLTWHDEQYPEEGVILGMIAVALFASFVLRDADRWTNMAGGAGCLILC